MAVNIKLKRSAVPGNVPDTSQLELGELALNTYDGKVFFKQDDGTQSIVELASYTSGSTVASASYALYAATAGTASVALNAISSSYSLSSSYSATATSASYALSASHSSTTISSSYATSASYAETSSYATNFNVSGNLVVGGDITAKTLHVQTVTSSIIYSSGSNIFGDATNDTQTLIGTVNISGSLNVTGAAVINNLTGSLYGTASWALDAVTAINAPRYTLTSSFQNFTQSYYNDSASVSIRVTNLEQFSASILNYTASTDAKITSIYNATASLQSATESLNAQTASLLNYTSSTDAKIASIYNATSSLQSATASLNAFSASILNYTASNNANIASLNAQTASLLLATASLNAFSASMLAFTASHSTGSFTGSFKGEFTGSFSGSLNNLQGTARHIPFFSSSQILDDSSIYQVGDSSVAINQNAVTTAAPEALYVWQPSTSSYNVISGKGNLDTYLQLNIQNTNQGPSASSDVVATANNGNETTNYIDMGINSENFSGFLGGPNDAYVYAAGNEFHIGNITPNKHLGFFVGGGDVDTGNKFALYPNNQHQMTGSLDVSGSVKAFSFTGSLLGNVTGSLFGTASFANNATSASYAFNATSASYALTASYAANVPDTASFAISASYAFNATSASFAVSASRATSASFASSGTGNFSGSFSGSFFGSGAGLTNISASSVVGLNLSQIASGSVTASVDPNGFKVNSNATISGSTQITGSLGVTGSVSITGSGTVLTANVDAISFTGSFAQLGSVTVVGSVNATSFTGSLLGTSSFAVSASQTQNAVSSSFASTASFVTLAQTASFVTLAQTASFVQTAQTASFVQNAQTASLAITASSADNFLVRGTLTAQTINVQTITSSVDFVTGSTRFGTLTSNTHQFTGSVSVSGSLAVNGSNVVLTNQTSSMSVLSASFASTASFVQNAQTASFVQNSQTASYVENAQTASFVTLAQTASFVQNAQTASFVTLAQTASFVQTAQTASYVLNAISASYALNADLLDGKDSSTFATTGSNIFLGNQTVTGSLFTSGSNTLVGITSLSGSVNISGSTNIVGTTNFSNSSTTVTGSLLISGSTTQIGNNTLNGNTTLSGSIVISGSLGTSTPTVKIYGDTQHNGYIRFDPVSTNVDNSISASYIYVSGSTNDLYFTQNGQGYSNTTRLRWLEGNLYTGLLNGGLITATTGSTTFNLSSGSGIIVNLGASLNENPYPTVKYINWGNFTSQSLTYLTSSIQSFIGIDDTGNIYQQNTAFNDGQYNTLITIGTVLHQNKSTVNASITYPNVAYGYKQRSYDFLKAFGPLKLSGLNIITSGSLGLNVGSGTAFADGRNYQVDPNNPSYITDPGTSVSKIFRYWQSGSEFVQDTNAGAGYTAIDPTQYNTGTALVSVSPSTPWTNQRVFWYPNSATKGIVVYYGKGQYASSTEALANLTTETFLEVENTKQNAVYLGSITIKYNGDFTTPSDYIISPAGIFRSIGGSGGGGSVVTTRLADLSDVSITGPTSGQALVYDTTAAKWENKSFISASISGNAATATSASLAATASFVTLAQTASFVTLAQTASFVQTAQTASFVQTAQTASFVLNAVSSSFAATASTATSATRASTVSISGISTNAEYSFPLISTGSSGPSIGLSNDTVSGFTYNPSTNLFRIFNLQATGSLLGTASFADNATTASLALTASSADNFLVRGTLTAQTIVAQTITSSIDFITGSTRFGTLLTNTHEFTGSVSITGSLNSPSITGSLLGTSSFANNTTSASYALSASYAFNSTSASHALTSSYSNNILGATNYIAKFSGNNSLTSSTIFENSTGVGINDVVPTHRFQVNGDSFIYNSSNTLNTTKYALLPALNVTTTGTETNQWANVGIYGSLGFSATSSTFTPLDKSFLSAFLGNVVKSGAGSVTGKMSSYAAASNFSGTGNVTTVAGFRAYAPLQSFAQPTFTGTVTNYIGLLIDDINGTTDIGSQITNRFGIYQSGSLDRNYFAGATIFANGLTGSLEGTASYAVTASYAMNAGSGGGGGLSALYIQDEGVTKGTASYIDFTGAGVTATVTGGTASIAITGGGGGGGGAQTFTQASPAISWSFTHNLGTYTPLVQVYDSSYNTIQPASIVGTSLNATTISFATATSGYAIISTGGSINITGSNVILSQTVAASTWSFNHGLNEKYPVFTVFDNNDDVIIPLRINAVNANTALIYFSSPRTGTAVAANCGVSGSFATSSFAVSASFAQTASFVQTAQTASFVQTAQTASYVLNAVSSSFASTASFVTLAQTASFVQTAQTASYVLNAVSASFASTASFVTLAQTASFVQTAQTASYVLNAVSSSFATNATSASFATNATTAQTASFATNFTVASTLILDATLTDYATVASSIVGSNNLFTLNTGSYTSAFFRYTVANGANTRAGEVIAAWNGSTTTITDFSTVDIGDTSAVTASVSIVSGQAQFNIQTNSSGWRLKSIGTFM